MKRKPKPKAPTTSELWETIITTLKQGEYEVVISIINDLLEITPEDFDCYTMLGHCQSMLDLKDEAKVSYSKAEEMISGVSNDKCPDITYTAEEMAAQVFTLEVKLLYTKYFEAEKYEDAIGVIDKYLEVFPDSARSYVRRGHCHQLMKNYLRALNDYREALELGRELPDEQRNGVEAHIEAVAGPVDVIYKQLSMYTTEDVHMPTSDIKKLKDYLAYQEFCDGTDKLFDTILGSTSPEFAEYRAAVRTVIEKGKFDAFALGYDPKEDDYFHFTMDELLKRLRKHPDRGFTFTGTAFNPNTGEPMFWELELGKRLAKRGEPVSESRRKERERKRRYYKRHKERLREKQRVYDRNHRLQNRFKHRNYYQLKNYGMSRSYNRLFHKGTDTIAFAESHGRETESDDEATSQ